MRWVIHGLLCSLTLLSLPCASPVIAHSEAAEDLLELVRVGNHAALSSIRTLSCRVSDSYIPKRKESDVATGEYWRAGDVVRVRYNSEGTTQDLVLKDSVVRSVVTRLEPKGPRKVATIMRDDRRPLCPCDAWYCGLLALPGPTKAVTILTLDELLKQPHELHRVARETDAGQELIYLKLSHARADLEIWFDPKVNYLVRKLVISFDDPQPKSGRRESRVVRFKEAAPAVYFPEEVESVVTSNGVRSDRIQRVTFSHILVNRPLPADAFDWFFPDGVTLNDLIEGKQFKADRAGNPIGASKTIPQITAVPVSSKQVTETREEPKPITRWLVPASAGILVLAGTLWLFRKRSNPVT